MPVKEIIMPAVESGQKIGFLVRWLKGAGDTVTEGEPVLEIETDKTVTEVEAPASGVLRDIRYDDESEVPVGTVVAVIHT
jgi:pyruvate/2-oxoglutarate dehydrogenase complex dihydrolipoamide acyltransferase (E2) component